MTMQHPNLRHDPPRRQPGRRRQLLAAGQAADHPAARRARLRLHRRGLSRSRTRRTPSTSSASASCTLEARQGLRLRHDAPQGHDGRPTTPACRRSSTPQTPVVHDRRQDVGLPRDRSAARHARREPGDDRRHASRYLRERRAARCSTTPSTSSTAGRPTPSTPPKRSRPRPRPARSWSILCDTNGGTLPEEIAELTRSGAASARTVRRAGRHPLPQRLRPGRRQLAGRRRRRRRAGAGDDQRHRRALRQRRPDLA